MNKPFMQIEEASKSTCDGDCNEPECDVCDPIEEEDVICGRCGEHAELREQTGTNCCGAGSMF
jgi:hypothetical protein